MNLIVILTTILYALSNVQRSLSTTSSDQRSSPGQPPEYSMTRSVSQEHRVKINQQVSSPSTSILTPAASSIVSSTSSEDGDSSSSPSSNGPKVTLIQSSGNKSSSFECPEQFGYYDDLSDCSKYFVCVFGEALHETCTGGLYFSAELQTCDWPRNVHCTLDTINGKSNSTSSG